MSIDGKSLGLALSGGGYRATLFSLGSLWRLNDAGLLGRLDRVTSVSGGSIAAGVLAQRWNQLAFADGRAANFVQVIADPIQAFCRRTIDVGATLLGIVTPFKSAGEYLVGSYKKHLFGDTQLGSLPAAGAGVPKFIFYATNLQTGRSFRFRQDMIADYMLGCCTGTSITLATAVAASSAFPPVFSPIVVKTKQDASWTDGSNLPDLEKLRRRIVLSDGGVYDNMGLESLIDNVDIALVCDAGAPFDIEREPHTDYFRQLGRVRDILIDQTRALRKRWLIDDFKNRRKRGAYWGIGTSIGDYKDPHSAFRDTQVTGGLAEVPTRLAAFEPEVSGRLINWGYALCDVALRMRAEMAVAQPGGLPLPQWPLH